MGLKRLGGSDPRHMKYIQQNVDKYMNYVEYRKINTDKLCCKKMSYIKPQDKKIKQSLFFPLKSPIIHKVTLMYVNFNDS